MSGGCSSSLQTYAGALSANPTYVSVMGRTSAPTRVVTSYSTEDTGLGTVDYIAGPQFIGDTICIFSYAADGRIRLTAWNRKTGTKRWSIKTGSGLRTSLQLRSLACDGTYLFAIWAASEAGAFSRDAVVCIDAATGKIVWNDTSLAMPSYAFSADGDCEIVVHVDSATGTADKLYTVAHEAKRDRLGMEHDRNFGVWCLDAATGKFISRFDLPMASPGWIRTCNLVCDADTLYVCTDTSETKPYTSIFTGYDVKSGKKLWEKDIAGGCYNDLMKQGDIITFEYNDLVSVWRTGTGAPAELWTRKLDARSGTGLYSDIAIDNTRLYLGGKGETVSAFALVTGDKLWSQRLNVHYQHHNNDDYNKIEDIEPAMNITSTRNVLYVNDGGGMIHALDPADGKALWARRFSQVDWCQTYIANQFVADYGDGTVTMIMADGKVNVWK